MIALAKQQPFYAVRFDGTIYDCGSKIGFLMANVAYALAARRPGAGAQGRAQEAALRSAGARFRSEPELLVVRSFVEIAWRPAGV